MAGERRSPLPGSGHVLILASQADATMAEELSQRLAELGIACVRPSPGGQPSQLAVVILSTASDTPEFISQISGVGSSDIQFLTVRLEPVLPPRGADLVLNSTHWFDAFGLSSAQIAPRLADAIRSATSRDAAGGPRRRSRQRVALGAASGLIATLVALTLWTVDGRRTSDDGQSEVDEALVGEFVLTQEDGGLRNTWSRRYRASGRASGDVELAANGRYQETESGVLLVPTGHTSGDLFSRSKEGGRGLALPGSAIAFVLQVPVHSNDASLWAFSSENLQWSLDDKSASQEEWTVAFEWGKQLWQGELVLTNDGTYTARLWSEEPESEFVASKGNWRLISDAQGVVEGRYEVLGKDRVIFGPLPGNPTLADTVWHRAE